jgi:Calcineurin-like phosphoesterase
MLSNRQKLTAARVGSLILLSTFSWRSFPAQSDARTTEPPSAKAAALTDGPSFNQWKAACDKLPSNRVLQGRMPAKDLLPLSRFRELDDLLTTLFDQCKTGALSRTNLWLDELPTTAGFFNTSAAYFLKSEKQRAAGGDPTAVLFQPFAQKLVVPEKAEVFFHADFHGDVRSLLADLGWLNEHGYLGDFKIKRPDFYMVFLGDYTDRGSYGIEVLYTLFRLKVANPDQVFLARGNHEEYSLQSRYGFLNEGRLKYGAQFDAKKVVRAYDFLPVVLYLGCGDNFIQCNHGGMEPGFNPRQLLDAPGNVRFQFLGTLHQHQFIATHPQWFAGVDTGSAQLAERSLQDFRPEDPINPLTLGFMWNDFSLLATEPQFAIDPGRAYVYGQKASQFLLQKGSSETKHLQAVFRGHQQSSAPNPMMRRLIACRGVFRHWQEQDSSALLNADSRTLEKVLESGDQRPIPPGSVWTFNVSPDSVYGEGCGYTFDAFGILKTARDFADWRFRVVNLTVGH